MRNRVLPVAAYLILIGVMAGDAPAGAQTWYPPDAPNAVRGSLLLAGGMDADAGFGLGLDYDVPLVEDLGPGRLLAGPLGAGVFARQEEGRGTCRLELSESVFALLGYVRFVLDAHPQLRPWVRAGLGLQFEQLEVDTLPNCAFDYDRTDTDVDPAGVISLGLDVDLSEQAFLTVSADSHQGADAFATLGMGVGIRF